MGRFGWGTQRLGIYRGYARSDCGDSPVMRDSKRFTYFMLVYDLISARAREVAPHSRAPLGSGASSDASLLRALRAEALVPHRSCDQVFTTLLHAH